jgi:TRAP-type C4-dicarboxylate transport system permease small subunit
MRAWDRLLDGLALGAGLILAAITLAVAGDVVSYATGFGSLVWTADMAAYGLLYATLMAAPWLLREGGHVTIESIRRTAPEGVQRVLRVLVGLVGAATCGLLAWGGVMLVQDSLARGAIDYRAIAIPRWVLYAPLPVSFALLGVEFLRGIGRPPRDDGMAGL